MSHSSIQQSEPLKEYIAAGWVFAGGRCPKPLRVVLRALAVLLWTCTCYLAVRGIQLFTIGKPDQRKERAKIIGRRWANTMRGLFGIRLIFIGTPPRPPFFLVGNHHTWLEVFGTHLIDVIKVIVMAESASFPIAGLLTRGMDPILVDRKRESVPMLVQKIIDAIMSGENLLIAPEGAVTPGHLIRPYHAALLEAAVATGTPVHYSTTHWRTPPGCLPPSKSVIYGPDSFMRDASGCIAASELDLWGPERSILPHLIHTLALPHCDMVVRFGQAPISSKDRFSLAQALHAATLEIFTPSA